MRRARSAAATRSGGLAVSFNEMVEGLVLKERYRSVLDVVTDHP